MTQLSLFAPTEAPRRIFTPLSNPPQDIRLDADGDEYAPTCHGCGCPGLFRKRTGFMCRPCAASVGGECVPFCISCGAAGPWYETTGSACDYCWEVYLRD